MRKDKRHELVCRILNKQLEKYGLTVDSPEIQEDWYDKYTQTEAEYEEWKRSSIEDIRKTMRWNKKLSEGEFAMLDLMYGLKVEEKNGEEN